MYQDFDKDLEEKMEKTPMEEIEPPRPTVVPVDFKLFNPEKDAVILRKAMRGLGDSLNFLAIYLLSLKCSGLRNQREENYQHFERSIELPETNYPKNLL